MMPISTLKIRMLTQMKLHLLSHGLLHTISTMPETVTMYPLEVQGHQTKAELLGPRDLQFPWSRVDR